ncbi:MAG: hypothetical protein K9G76_05710 [Bacteroidales bacterium]|nr:hypothetical protein [Bacteroidales bacterium]MCF8402476.1 hypothetical protein [Bacteroidales bacterium]
MFEIKEVTTNKALKAFILFPYTLYKQNKYWVPPIINDEYSLLQPELNPSFESCDVKLWLAYHDTRCVGRICAIINRDYNQLHNSKFGRISRVEFIDDLEVSKELFKVAETWLKDMGMNTVHGPLGFNNLDNQGLLIEGFDHLPSIASVYHLPYYQNHFEKLGYEKENDWIEFRLTMGEVATKKASRGAEIVKKRYGFEVVKFQSNKEMFQYLHPIFELLNKAFLDLPYVTPFTKKMIDAVGKKYFKVLNPKFARIIKKDDEIIAFLVALPSLSKAMQKANGKLFPLGFYHIMKALKKPEVVDLLLTGVLPEYQSAGAAVILFAEVQQEMLAHGINQMETTGIFETNHNVISNWKNYEHIQHKRRRCFIKSL